MADMITLEGDAIPKNGLVAGFEGQEGISDLYEFRVGISLLAGQTLDLNKAVGTTAKLNIWRTDGEPISYKGILASAELLHAWDDQTLYQVVLVPQLWKLGLTRHSWVWINTTIDAVIKKVLERNGLSGDQFELKLQASYETREHICQFDESDLDFICRWMEREGMYYYFDHSGDTEKLIISDGKTYDEGRPDVRYVAGAEGDRATGECLGTVRCKRRSVPKEVKQADYNYRTPASPPTGSGNAASDSVGVMRYFAENFREGGEGSRLAKVRAETFLRKQEVYHGEGRVHGIRTGYTFTLIGHPLPDMNAEYLAVRVRHSANQAVGGARVSRLLGIETEEVYTMELEAISKEAQFRPERRAPIPRIDGAVHGVVDGSGDSEYAQLDDQGRYLVRIQFDESDAGAGEHSMRVRMMQPHAGNPEGFHFPLRKDTEVLLVFLGGDPDRPFIAGAVPNPQTPSPVTSSNHTENVIWTGGNNRIVIDDQDGSQYIHIHTPTKDTYQRMGSPHGDHHLKWHTNGMCGLYVGKNNDIEIGDDGGGNETKHVYGDVTETFDGKHTLTVKLDREILVEGSQIVHVLCDEVYTVDGDQTTVVGKSRDTTITSEETTDVGTNQTLKVGSDQKVNVGGNRVVTIDGKSTVEVKGGRSKLKVTGTHRTETDTLETFVLSGGHTERVTGAFNGAVSGDYTQSVTGDYKLNCMGQLVVKCHGPAESTQYADTTEKYYGKKTSRFIGENYSMEFAMKSDIGLSGTLVMKAGMEIGINSTLSLVKKSVHLAKLEAKLKADSAEVEKHDAAIKSGSLLVFA